MSKPQLTLWLLNRVVGWEHEPMLGALRSKYDVRLGRRAVTAGAPGFPRDCVELAVNEGQEGAAGELMYEGAALGRPGPVMYDEYFVPIPVKCVGHLDSTFWRGVASEQGLARLAELKGHLERRFPNGNPFDETQHVSEDAKDAKDNAEKIIGPHFGPVLMNLADRSMGYYEILQRATQQSGAKNVLIGYSQGGTVARYLAFLDEHVARPEKRCIHGIITVQSPNRGSPVAAKSKNLDVSRGILGVMLSLPRWLPPEFRAKSLWKFLASAPNEYSLVTFVSRLLDEEIHSWKGSPGSEPLLNTWLTARKWLSGLSGVPELAFYDLDPLRCAEPGAVLQALADHPLQTTLHGAVIGANSSLYDFLHALMAKMPWYVKLVAWWERKWLRELVTQADDIYRTDVMSFPEGAPGSLISDYAAGMSKGSNGLDGTIEKLDHDFVIPSVSQVLLPITPAHLGNLVNEDASHITGSEGFAGRDGRTDQDMVVSLLRKM